ncbi:MAG: hypothetical protein J7K40_13030 [candidate division Zixibacteria bacterium]|nr:hypothetical protein [candidate division Zixibacteria bacterium]
MDFNENTDHKISLAEAAKLTKQFQRIAMNEDINNSDLHYKSIVAHSFRKTTLISILNQAGCIGIRIYYGLHDDGRPELVLIGIDSQGDDITDGEIAQHSVLCPPFCSSQNELNILR